MNLHIVYTCACQPLPTLETPHRHLQHHLPRCYGEASMWCVCVCVCVYIFSVMATSDQVGEAIKNMKSENGTLNSNQIE